jgi:hypothetical protein
MVTQMLLLDYERYDELQYEIFLYDEILHMIHNYNLLIDGLMNEEYLLDEQEYKLKYLVQV